MVQKVINQAVEDLKGEYKKIYTNDASMFEYCAGRISNCLKLECGLLYEFEKPRVKKDFCFGAGQNGICTTEDWQDANDMVSVANNDNGYFIQKNMDDAFGTYKRLFEDMERGWALYAKATSYCNYKGELKIAYIYSEKHLVNRFQWDDDKDTYTKLTDKDIENLKAVIKEEQDKFGKRLNTYLKRYGLSKVHAWSYISD